MAHVRQQIRDAVVTLLTGGPLLGTNVYSMRFQPLNETVETAAIVYTVTETIAPNAMGMGQPSTQVRQLTLNVEAYTLGTNDTVHDEADDLAAEIEAAMAGDPTLGGLVKDVYLTEYSGDVNIESKRAMGIVGLSYTVIYRLSPAAPEVSLP